jgi:hypothetical protein
VEVITAYSLDGPAVDPDQLRKAEARAKLEVASLQKKLDVGGRGGVLSCVAVVCRGGVL